MNINIARAKIFYLNENMGVIAIVFQHTVQSLKHLTKHSLGHLHKSQQMNILSQYNQYILVHYFYSSKTIRATEKNELKI